MGRYPRSIARSNRDDTKLVFVPFKCWNTLADYHNAMNIHAAALTRSLHKNLLVVRDHLNNEFKGLSEIRVDFYSDNLRRNSKFMCQHHDGLLSFSIWPASSDCLRSSWKLLVISRETDLSKSKETFSENCPSLTGAKSKILTCKWRNIFCAVYQRGGERLMWESRKERRKLSHRFKPSAIIIVSNDSDFFSSWQMVHYGKFLFVPDSEQFFCCRSLSNRLRSWGFSLALMLSLKWKRNFDGFISG